MLHWANQCDILLFLDSNRYTHTAGTYECIVAAGAMSMVIPEAVADPLSDLKEFHTLHKDWLFGHINYDFKNRLEQLHSGHPANFNFGEISFFRPITVCYILRNENQVWIETTCSSPERMWEEIFGQTIDEPKNIAPLRFKKRLEQEDYVQIIAQLQKHISEGDCYEINFCNETFCNDANINPVSCFEQLNHLSKAPFAAYYKLRNQYLMCASPERYLRKENNKITAQPIKGTARRGQDEKTDAEQKEILKNSIKERAENVMIVDLMRNDLARFCTVDSVQVEELFGIYTFPQVHQMISTISGELRSDLSLFDAIRLSFPVGSMTGAPKIMVMHLIEQYEKARRELFSGCVGYIDPKGNFDFNVVIRSICYNDQTKYLSYQTGGAITYDSDPLQEWEETRLKASAIEKVFG